MEYKPILTYSGAGPLFRSLESHIVTQITQDTTEWKRPFGRTVKNVRVGVQFQQFDSALLENYKKGNWNILQQPVLHLYVTECNDIETYKSIVKDEIDSWLKTLQSHDISDWMILILETIDVRKSKNILPRTTVLDKVRLDFASKNGDRCISVLNPMKFELKATESFRCFLQRLRHLILVGYTRHITKYEELIRANREKRNQEGWNFIRYFKLQEQLAFVLEMLGQHMEALVQYDELDALFSQFIMNSAHGENPKWLSVFEKPFTLFHGITLDKKKLMEYKVSEDTTLLQFRGYLFARQCVLLREAEEVDEATERLLPFLFTTLREVDILKIDVPKGAMACWQFVSALEVLYMCDEAVETKGTNNCFKHCAPIWNLAKDKLYELGKLCGLLPGFTPTSEQLHMVVQLSAGIGDTLLDEEAVLKDMPREKQDKRDRSPNRATKKPPTERLKEALGSNQMFQKLYLELSELAISTYKHVSYLRSARLAGLDLGNFYCTLNESQKAVVFFTDLLRELKSENWSFLASQTLLELASSYRKMNDNLAYTKTCATISCCIDLEILVRTFYFDEFLKSLKLIETPEVNDEQELKILQDDLIVVEVKLENNFPREIFSECVSLSFEMVTKDSDEKIKQVVRFNGYETYEMKKKSLPSIAVQESRSNSSTRRKISPTTRRDFTNSLKCDNVLLKPGTNVLELTAKGTRVGKWNFRQLSIVIKQLDFLTEQYLPVSCNPFDVITKPASAILSFKNLVAGIEQDMNLIVSGGSFIFPKESTITLRCSKNMHVRLIEDNEFKPDLVIHLNEFKSFDERTIPLKVTCSLPGLKTDKPIEHKISMHLPWQRNEQIVPVHFIPAIMANCRLHTCGTRKYLQILVKGAVETKIMLSNASMSCDLKGVSLNDLNPKAQNNLTIFKGLTISYLWEIEFSDNSFESNSSLIRVKFNMDFASAEKPNDLQHFISEFDLTEYLTIFKIQAKVEPSELCRVGSVCHMTLTITKVHENSFADLMYEVLADQNMWAVVGRTAGVVSMQNVSSQTIALEVLPLSAGFLPLPNVRLSKYISIDGIQKDVHRKLQPFMPGQVYNSTKSLQIHVLASNNND